METIAVHSQTWKLALVAIAASLLTAIALYGFPRLHNLLFVTNASPSPTTPLEKQDTTCRPQKRKSKDDKPAGPKKRYDSRRETFVASTGRWKVEDEEVDSDKKMSSNILFTVSERTYPKTHAFVDFEVIFVSLSSYLVPY
jgi:hypothetical protein